MQGHSYPRLCPLYEECRLPASSGSPVRVLPVGIERLCPRGSARRGQQRRWAQASRSGREATLGVEAAMEINLRRERPRVVGVHDS